MSSSVAADQMYRGLVRALPDVGVVLTSDGRFVELLTNDHNRSLLYDDPENLTGKSIFDVFPESKADRFHATIRRAIETDSVQTVDYELDVNDGVRHFEGYVAPIPGDDTTDVVWIAEDVTTCAEPEQWLARVNAIVTDSDRSFEETLETALALGCERFDFESGCVGRVDGENERLEIDFATGSADGLAPGTTLPLTGVSLASAGASELALVVDSLGLEHGSTADVRAAGGEEGRDFGLYIPVDGDDDRMLLFRSATSREGSLGESERLYVTLLGQWLQYEFERTVHEQRKQRIEAIFDQTYQFTGLLEPDGTLVEANRTALEFGGLDRADVIGEKMWDTHWFRHSEATRNRIRDAVRRAAEGEFVRYELTIKGTDREAVIDFSVRPVTDEDGEVTLLIPEGRDITERKERERELQTCSTAMTASIDGMAVLDADGEYTFANQAHADIYGYDDPDAFLGESWRICYGETEISRFEDDVIPTLYDEGAWRGEAVGQRRDGTAFPQELSLTVTDDGDIICVVRDITERRQHEEQLEALHEASTRLWTAGDEQELAEITIDIVERVLDEHLVTVWSYDETTDRLVPLAASDDAATLDGSHERDDEVGAIQPDSAEMRAFRDGETRVVEDYQTLTSRAHPGTPLRTLLIVPLGEHGQLHVGSETVVSFDNGIREMIDILARTVEAALERQVRERTLEQSRDWLARTEYLADVGGWELDLQTNQLRWTDGTHRIHEVPDDFDPTLDDGVGFYHPDDRETIDAAVTRCRENGEPYTEEARLVTAEGHERWVEATGEPVEVDGEIIGLRGAIRDVTDRKEREQQLSVLYRILRHNLRNDINVAEGFSEAITRELDRLVIPPEVAGREVEAFDRVVDHVTDSSTDLERDVEALGRMITTLSEVPVDEVRTYGERTNRSLEKLMSLGNKATRLHDLIVDEETGWCGLEPTIETVLDDVRRDYPDASIELGGVASVTVHGAPGKVELVLRELLDNACRHGESGSPTVEVRADQTGESHVTVEIVDRGPGVPEVELEAIRQGKEEELVHSSGLGLWLVSWLMSDLGGRVQFEPNEPRGTVVSLTFSTVDGPPSTTVGEVDE